MHSSTPPESGGPRAYPPGHSPADYFRLTSRCFPGRDPQAAAWQAAAALVADFPAYADDREALAAEMLNQT